MNDLAIKVSGLSKKYYIGVKQERYKTLRDTLTDVFVAPFKKAGKLLRGQATGASGLHETIWALKDVSFEVKKGEVVGIIGRNGAGKSTLLKILSRITEPTEGYADVYGRVGSLLEVGTGFHPELTGRENIYLNGAILGMKRFELNQKFDEIVSFAEVEKFIDTPVKHYSSGMYLRLAFAVAAHLEPEILLVDEVLAVGDAAFQKKCLGKMGDVAKEGLTVLFVSHNMTAVKRICDRGILLDNGSIQTIGDIDYVVSQYLVNSIGHDNLISWKNIETAPGNNQIRLKSVGVSPLNTEQRITIDTGAKIEVGFFNYLENSNIDITIYLRNSEGIIIFESGILITTNQDSKKGYYKAVCDIPPHLLNADIYSFRILFGQNQRYKLFEIEDIVSFDVENTATGRGSNMSKAPGVIRPILKWYTEYTGNDSTTYKFGNND